MKRIVERHLARMRKAQRDPKAQEKLRAHLISELYPEPAAPLKPTKLPPMQATQISIPEVTPPLVAEIPPQQAWPPLAPFVPVPPGPPVFTGTPVVLPPPATVLPEPSSLLLVASGLGGLLLFARRKMRQGVPTAAQAIPVC